MTSTRIAALAGTLVLSLAACSGSTAGTYSFETAIGTAETHFHAETTIRVDGETVSTVACDIDREVARMQCLATEGDRMIKTISDLARKTHYLSLTGFSDSAQWLELGDGDTGKLNILGPVTIDPLAQLAAVAGAEFTAGDTVVREGESIREYRVELDTAAALIFTQQDAADGETVSATGFTFYVTATDALRGYTYTYSGKDGTVVVETWLSALTATPAEVPADGTTVTMDELIDLGAVLGQQYGLEVTVLSTAEAVASQANNAGGLAADGLGPNVDDIITAIDELVVGDQWTITGPEQIRLYGCADITFTEPGGTSTAHIRIDLGDGGARSAVAAPGACML